MAENKIETGNISRVSGEVNIAAGDIVKNINTIHQRALTAAEESARARKLESKLLAQGVATLVHNLSNQATEGAQTDTPYKGLLSYGLNEAEIFYGRDEAKKDLLNSLKQGPLTVLHAESGAGKTSLLQAGIAAQLIANGHLAIHLRSHDADPVEFIKRMFLPELMQAPVLAAASLREFLRQVCAVLGPKVSLYLLLDQFEEFFNFLKKEERQPFLKSLADCLNDPSLKVRWVLALRAEALSDLAELEAFGISPFKNMYRLNRLSRAEAREAIIEPARRYEIQFEPVLIEYILDTLTTNDEVMPTHLQLVCSALTDTLPEDKALTLAYYIEQEGGTEGILRDYLKRQLEHLPGEERALAWKVLRTLITADRQRTVKTYDEIVHELKSSGISNEQIDTILGRLIERRLLFSQPTTTETFELAHDYLVKEIELDPQEQARKAAQELLDQETRTYKRHKTLISAERLAVIDTYRNELHFSEEAGKLLTESEKVIRASKRRRLQILAILSTTAILVAIIMSILAINANRQARSARAGELAAQSVAFRDKDFQLSLLLGIEAFRTFNSLRTYGNLLDVAVAHPQLLQFLEDGTLSVVALSPDGKTLAISDGDSIILWDVNTYKKIGEPLQRFTGSVYSVAFSPDGTKLASGGDNGSLILWDVDTQQPIGQPLWGHQGFVWIAFSPDGTKLASLGSNDSKVILWDVNTQQQIEEWSQGYASMAFSPDGTKIALGGDDGSIILWDVDTYHQIGEPLHDHQGFVWGTFSPDGKILASWGSDEGSLILWDVDTQQPIGQPLKGQERPVFSPDGTILASSSADLDSIILWDVDTQRQIAEPLQVQVGTVNSVVFSPDGTMLALGGDDGITFWQVSGGYQIGRPLRGHAGYIYDMTFSPDGTKLVSSGSDGKTILWHIDRWLQIGELVQLQAGPTFGGVTSLAFNLDGTKLALGSMDGTIILWDMVAQQQINEPLYHYGDPLLGTEGFLFSITFSPDGKILASAGSDGTVILWNIDTQQQIGEPLPGPVGASYNVAFSPDGKILASGNKGDGSVILWDVNTRQQIGEPLPSGDNYVLSVAFSPDGQMLASGSEVGTVVLWDVETHQQIGEPFRRAGSTVTFSPDGKILATGSILWDINTRQRIGGVLREAGSVVFSPDGKMLASISSDLSGIILWDAATHQQIGEPLPGGGSQVWSVAFSPDSTKLVWSEGNNIITLLDLNPQLWLEKSCQRAGRNFTHAEWAQYFPNDDYHKTCEQWPLEPEATSIPSSPP